MSLELMQRIRPTPAAVLAKRARELTAAGADIVNLASGDVDHAPPQRATEAAAQAASAATVPYTNIDGEPSLRSAIAHDASQRWGRRVADSQVIVSTGSKQSIFNALFVCGEPGAEVILPSPYWSSHLDIATLARYRTVVVPCGADTDFKLNGAMLEAAITPATRWLVLTDPSSPVGSVYSHAELQALGTVLARHPQVRILCDELYEAFVFGSARHVGFAAACPELAARTLTVGGVSKTYAMMGWRIGWAIGDGPLISRMASLQSQVTSSPSTIGQAAALAALMECAAHRSRVVSFVEANRARAMAAIERIPGLRVASGSGSLYLFLELLDHHADDAALAERLLLETGLVVLPGRDCGAPGFVRINIARKPVELQSGMERLAAFLHRRA